jgi:hypothetical protein
MYRSCLIQNLTCFLSVSVESPFCYMILIGWLGRVSFPDWSVWPFGVSWLVIMTVCLKKMLKLSRCTYFSILLYSSFLWEGDPRCDVNFMNYNHHVLAYLLSWQSCDRCYQFNVFLWFMFLYVRLFVFLGVDVVYVA